MAYNQAIASREAGRSKEVLEMSKGRETKRRERRERAQKQMIENNKQKRETLNDILRISDVRYTVINLRRVM